jgi:hypothetical protein
MFWSAPLNRPNEQAVSYSSSVKNRWRRSVSRAGDVVTQALMLDHLLVAGGRIIRATELVSGGLPIGGLHNHA